jgi:prepilin-type N-terminal cleavage/methylation domain-containing protein
MLLTLLHKMSVPQPKGNNQLSSPNLSTQGLTIIECLVAMVIASVVLAFISPPILLSVATRIQNQKAEQSFALAQSEVDRVRALLERGGTYTNDDLPPFGADDIGTDPPFAPPSSGAAGFTTVRADMTATKGLAVDVNQDGTYDFVVQTFRDDGQAVSDTDSTLIAFDMEVRVYAYKALTGGGTLLTKAAPLGFTSGDGSQNTRPLSVIYTRLTRSDSKESFCKYVEELDPNATCP